MAPLPTKSSPEAPSASPGLIPSPDSLSASPPPPDGTSSQLDDRSASISPSELFDPATLALDIYKRDVTPTSTSTFVPGVGAQGPETFNNAGILALFAIIGTAMVIASIWFFFWAKNGGFQFRQGDWDDYKSTVLRRKGPDGKTLSNATKSTKLGGSTIAGTQHYKWAKQAARSVISRDEKGRKGILAKRGWAGTHSVTYSDDYMTESFGSPRTESDEMTQVLPVGTPDPNDDPAGLHAKRYRDRDVREYKRERPARVGGLNRVADGSHYTPTASSEPSEVHSEAPMLPPGNYSHHHHHHHHHNNSSNTGGRDRDRDRAERRARDEAARMERRWKREAEEAAAALARETAAANPRRASASPSKPSGAKTRGHHHHALPSEYTASSSTSAGQRSASYYDEYRPKTGADAEKKKKAARAGGGGYRRGADSDLD